MAVRHFSNPVSLARLVMRETSHCALSNEGALAFARKIGFPILDDPMELVTAQAKKKCNSYLEYQNAVSSHIEGRPSEECHDTVGAVAIDASGRLACATSTGEDFNFSGLRKERYVPGIVMKCCVNPNSQQFPY